jgi:hypothetical protein
MKVLVLNSLIRRSITSNYPGPYPLFVDPNRPLDRYYRSASGFTNATSRQNLKSKISHFETQRSPVIHDRMFVEEIPKPSSTIAKKPARGSVLYGRTVLDSGAQQARITRHLTELDQDNYHAIQIDIPKSDRSPQERKY